MQENGEEHKIDDKHPRTGRDGTARCTIAIFDGDPILRMALEALLQAAGYRTRFLRDSAGDELAHQLADSHLLLIAPELSSERKRILSDMTPGATPLNVPVLELLPDEGKPVVEGGCVTSWPCQVEDLKRAIDAALIDDEQV